MLLKIAENIIKYIRYLFLIIKFLNKIITIQYYIKAGKYFKFESVISESKIVRFNQSVIFTTKKLDSLFLWLWMLFFFNVNVKVI